MSWRGLLVLAFLCAAAVAAVFLVRAPEAPKEPGGGALLGFEPRDVEALDLEHDGTRVRVERRGADGWAMTSPREAEADPRAVLSLLRTLSEARRVREVEAAGAGGGPFGLDPAQATVRLSMKGGAPPRNLAIGRASPVSADRYARVDAGPVLLADASLASVEEKGADDLVERRLLPVETERMRRIEIDRPAGRLVLAREGTSWSLSAPFADRADDSAADALARTLASLEFARGAPPSPPPAPGALPVRVRVEADGGVILEARLAARGDGNVREAARWPSGAAGRVPEAGARELERSASEFRDRKLLSFSIPDVRGIDVRSRAGSLALRRDKEGAPWTVAGGGGPVDGSRVEDFLDRVRWLRGKAVDREFPGAETTVAVLGEKGEIARVEIGAEEPAPAGGEPAGFLARSSWRPGVVFSIEAASVGPVPKSAADLAPAPSPSASPKAP